MLGLSPQATGQRPDLDQFGEDAAQRRLGRAAELGAKGREPHRAIGKGPQDEPVQGDGEQR